MENRADRKKLNTRLAIITFLIYFLNWGGVKFYLYSSIWWYDMPMHFLGGVWVAAILLWFFPVTERSKNYFLKVSLGVLFVGLSWEVFEYVFNNVLAGNVFDPTDTISDVFFDMAGGLSLIWYFSKRILYQTIA